LSFDAVGLPGFQFIQDEIEYDSRTHHSNMDVYERIQPQDMMRNAVIVASFVYNAANRDDKLPRKPLPKPAPSPTRTPQPGRVARGFPPSHEASAAPRSLGEGGQPRERSPERAALQRLLVPTSVFIRPRAQPLLPLARLGHLVEPIA